MAGKGSYVMLQNQNSISIYFSNVLIFLVSDNFNSVFLLFFSLFTSNSEHTVGKYIYSSWKQNYVEHEGVKSKCHT